jgi:hypothetical protein
MRSLRVVLSGACQKCTLELQPVIACIPHRSAAAVQVLCTFCTVTHRLVSQRFH